MQRRTILMDLQGTLGGDPMGDITSFEFFPRAINALKALSNRDCRLIVLTNQSRISKGFITNEIFELHKENIVTAAKANGISQLEFYCCPHTSAENCQCKKPNTGLFENANLKEAINKDHCFMVGDMGMSDMLLAHNLGIRKILVLTGVGEGSLNEYRSTWDMTEPDFVASDIYEAAMWILKQDIQPE